MHHLPATHPDDADRLDTAEFRRRFLADGLFRGDGVSWTWSAEDRLLLGGAVLGDEPLTLEPPEELHAAALCENRELAVVALDGAVRARVDGDEHRLDALDVLYVGRGAERIELAGAGRVYLVSAVAHADRPTALARRGEVFAADLGDRESSNERTVRRYIHADGVTSSALVLGITTLHPGSVWNTLPAHTHARRTEVYLYTGLGDDGRVVHLAGAPSATRSIIVAEGEAVVSPGWSVHCGAGTRAYSFVWAMAGENLDYADMDQVDVESLR